MPRRRPTERRSLRLAEVVIGAFVVVLLYLAAGTFVALLGTSVAHTFGDGFSLKQRADGLTTAVIVQNRAPVSFPGVKIPYSYGAEIVKGNVTCQLVTAEGVEPCGQITIDLGTIEQGERKEGPVTIFPNGQNFTVKFAAYISIFSLIVQAGSVTATCSTTDGMAYACKREGPETGVQEAPIPGFPLESLIAGLILGIALILLTRKARKDHPTLRMTGARLCIPLKFL